MADCARQNKLFENTDFPHFTLPLLAECFIASQIAIEKVESVSDCPVDEFLRVPAVFLYGLDGELPSIRVREGFARNHGHLKLRLIF